MIELGHDTLPLDAASRICNSELLSKGDQARASAISRGKEFRAAATARRPHSARHPPPPPLSPPLASLQLIVFAFHDSKTLRETIEEGKAMQLLVTVLFLD